MPYTRWSPTFTPPKTHQFEIDTQPLRPPNEDQVERTDHGALSPWHWCGDVPGPLSARWPPQERAAGGVRRRPRHLHLSHTAGGGRRGARLAPADDLAGRGLSPTVAAPCARAPDPGRALLWVISSYRR